MTDNISPVTDSIYHFPGGFEPQVAPAVSELPASAMPLREGVFSATEKDDDDLAETAQALYVEAISSPQPTSQDEVDAGREQVHSAYAQSETPIYDSVEQEFQRRRQVEADRVSAERHAQEALARARAFTDGVMTIRDHAERLAVQDAGGEYTPAA